MSTFLPLICPLNPLKCPSPIWNSVSFLATHQCWNPSSHIYKTMFDWTETLLEASGETWRFRYSKMVPFRYRLQREKTWLFNAALWSPAGNALVYDVCCVFVTFPCGILGQMWYLIVSIPDLCHLSYFVKCKQQDFVACEQQSCRPACTSAQSVQHLFYSLSEKHSSQCCSMQTFNILSSLGSSAVFVEPYLVGNPNDRFSRDKV